MVTLRSPSLKFASTELKMPTNMWEYEYTSQIQEEHSCFMSGRSQVLLFLRVTVAVRPFPYLMEAQILADLQWLLVPVRPSETPTEAVLSEEQFRCFLALALNMLPKNGRTDRACTSFIYEPGDALPASEGSDEEEPTLFA